MSVGEVITQPESKPTKKAPTKKTRAKSSKAKTSKSAKNKSVKKTGESKPRKRGNLKASHFQILEVLNKNSEPLTRAALSKKTGIKKGWSKLLGASTFEDVKKDSLEGLGFVKSQLHEGERTVGYSITAAGRKALEAAKQAK